MMPVEHFDKLRGHLPFGQVRTNVTSPNSQAGVTDLSYTGQRDLGMGLMDYKARFYSPTLGRFTQPDAIVPHISNPQTWNRYSYVMNSPILYNDPTGHRPVEDKGGGCVVKAGCSTSDERDREDYLEDTYGTDDLDLVKKQKEMERLCNTEGCSYRKDGSPDFPYEGIEALKYAMDFGIALDDVFKWGKALNPNPGLDMVAGVVGQVLSDLDKGNLTFGQRVVRAAIAGGESGITGVASVIIGGTVAGGTSGLGYAVGQVRSSVLIDQIIWEGVNEELFPYLGLGAS